MNFSSEFPPGNQLLVFPCLFAARAQKVDYFTFSFSWILLEGVLFSVLVKVEYRGTSAGRSLSRAQLPASGKSKLHAALAGHAPPQVTRGHLPKNPTFTPRSSRTQISTQSLSYHSPGLSCPGKASRRLGEVRQHHVVRLVCGGEDTADRASADMNRKDEPRRMSFSPGGAAPAKGQLGGDAG